MRPVRTASQNKIVASYVEKHGIPAAVKHFNLTQRWIYKILERTKDKTVVGLATKPGVKRSTLGFCTSCGMKRREGWRFCGQCGHSLKG